MLWRNVLLAERFWSVAAISKSTLQERLSYGLRRIRNSQVAADNVEKSLENNYQVLR
jgi:hypothetical protein